MIARTEGVSEFSEPAVMIARIGKVCRNTEKVEISKTDARRFINQNVIAKGHHGLLEHISVTFKVDGVSRALSHQLVRHRIASFVQESQRHVTLDADDESFVIPNSISSEDEMSKVFDEALEVMTAAYYTMLRHGIPKEDARFILPNATKTSIIITMNLRSYINFFHLRLAKEAQWEIRTLAGKLYSELVIMYPFIKKLVEGDEYKECFKECDSVE